MNQEQTNIETIIAEAPEIHTTDFVKQLDDLSLALVGGGEMVVAL